MKLLDLQNGETKVWEEKGYLLPKYDREELKKKTKETNFVVNVEQNQLLETQKFVRIVAIIQII